MGIFHEQVEVVNRTAEKLEIIFDGQRTYLEPNYNADGTKREDVHNFLPRQVIPYALNQTVIHGTEAALDPGAFESYIGVLDRKDKKKRSWHNCEFVDRSTITEVTRVSEEAINEELIADPNFQTKRGGKKRTAIDARDGLRPTAPFDIRQA